MKSSSLWRGTVFYSSDEAIYSFLYFYFHFSSQATYNPEAATTNSNDKEPGPCIWKDQVLVWLCRVIAEQLFLVYWMIFVDDISEHLRI